MVVIPNVCDRSFATEGSIKSVAAGWATFAGPLHDWGVAAVPRIFFQEVKKAGNPTGVRETLSVLQGGLRSGSNAVCPGIDISPFSPYPRLDRPQTLPYSTFVLKAVTGRH